MRARSERVSLRRSERKVADITRRDVEEFIHAIADGATASAIGASQDPTLDSSIFSVQNKNKQ